MTKENITDIIDLMLEDVNRRLKDREISISLTDAAKEYIVENGYEPTYGARPLKRFLTKHVETLAAKLILEDQVQPGDTISIDYADGQLVGTAIAY